MLYHQGKALLMPVGIAHCNLILHFNKWVQTIQVFATAQTLRRDTHLCLITSQEMQNQTFSVLWLIKNMHAMFSTMTIVVHLSLF